MKEQKQKRPLMPYMLDTNICHHIIKQKPLQVLERLRALPVSGVGISSITLSELEYGVAKSSRPEQNRDALSAFLAPLEILSFDERAALHYGEVRAYLERNGIAIGGMDMLIAAHAIGLSAMLVTNNVREFERVDGLRIERWS